MRSGNGRDRKIVGKTCQFSQWSLYSLPPSFSWFSYCSCLSMEHDQCSNSPKSTQHFSFQLTATMFFLLTRWFRVGWLSAPCCLQCSLWWLLFDHFWSFPLLLQDAIRRNFKNSPSQTNTGLPDGRHIPKSHNSDEAYLSSTESLTYAERSLPGSVLVCLLTPMNSIMA